MEFLPTEFCKSSPHLQMDSISVLQISKNIIFAFCKKVLG